MTMTNKELSAAIRADLKAAGIPKSAYSISVKAAGYDTSIRVRVKDLSVSLSRVTSVLNRYHHVDWDERCMEILAGGNTYVWAEYDRDALAAAAEPWRDRAAEILAADRPLYVGDVIANYSRNGHSFELVYFKGDNVVCAHKKDSASWYGNKCYAGSVGSLAEALAIFNGCGTFAR